MTASRVFLGFFCILFGSSVFAAAVAQNPSRFETDVKPVLVAKCGDCHRPAVRKGDLDLSSLAGLHRGGESGESAVGRSLEESPLWTQVESGEMPPEGETQLTLAERETIRKWILADGMAEQSSAASVEPLTQHDVLPIVLLRCVACHGRSRQEGGLDLRTVASMRRGGNRGPALVEHDPDSSLMVQRIESEACPPRELLLKFFIRRPPESEIDVLRQWIAEGATEFDVPADVATVHADPLVTSEDRQHWSFQPPRKQTTVDSIDELLLEKLVENGLSFAPMAERDVLIRRAYVDLIGMPPSVEQWQRWRSDRDPNWYQQMIEDLLASPEYGERWGRYWLDLAGYADSEGGVSADPIRQVAWKYRDYVIRAFNDDKPYNEFLIQQLAGDELVDYEHAKEITEAMVENLVATGFLRMGIDQTGSRTMNFVPERLGVIGDAITVVGEGLMGMTLGCARCHSHKYDPLPQRDYYRFKAIFQGALDEHDWLTFKNRSLQIDVSERRQRVADVNPPLQIRLRQLNNELKQAKTDWQLALLVHHYPGQSDDDRSETIRALRIADNNRTLPQRILVEMLQRVEILDPDQQPSQVIEAEKAIAVTEMEIIEVTRQMEPSLKIRALWDRGEPSPTYLLRRGEHNQAGQLVGPGVPAVLTDGMTPFVSTPPFAGKTGRRLAFARWLTRSDHPLTARVMVNRIWYHHFGTGLVSTLENFGIQGELPSHPELLDWLAIEFVERGWSIKAMHRLIMNSRAYRQTSRNSEESLHNDPQNRLLSRMPLRRLDAEAIRDSLLFVSGRLERSGGGPPDLVSVARDGLVNVLPTAGGQWRRSVYLQYRRTEIPTLMETFDYPEMGPNCLTRSISNTSPQSLLLMNNEHVWHLARSLAKRVREQVGKEGTRVDLVNGVYQRALTRLPTDREISLGSEMLQVLAQDGPGNMDQALEAYCHAILNSANFLYVD
ncbi:MAG: PSD1 and planctomycete cytochrome C domain-containing protein [Rubripirellula sp.]|nr:PSD1 and planctomycete cytochrome C domain-containing protein [Rubripirellula sp.]